MAGLEVCGVGSSVPVSTRAAFPGRRPERAQDARPIAACGPWNRRTPAIFFGRDAAIVRGWTASAACWRAGRQVAGRARSVRLGKSSFLRAGLWPRLARDDAAFLPLPVIRPRLPSLSGNAGLAEAIAATYERLGAPRQARRHQGEARGRRGRLRPAARRAARSGEATAGRSRRGRRQTPPSSFRSTRRRNCSTRTATPKRHSFPICLARSPACAGQEARRRGASLSSRPSDRTATSCYRRRPRSPTSSRRCSACAPIAPTEFKSVIEGPARRVDEAGGKLEIEPALTEQLIADARAPTRCRCSPSHSKRSTGTIEAPDALRWPITPDLAASRARSRRLLPVRLPNRASRPPFLRIPRRNIRVCGQRSFRGLRGSMLRPASRCGASRGWMKSLPPPRPIVERLVRERLLIADRRDGIDVLEVAHESLLRQWPALASWLEADADNLKLIEGVERAANEWASNGRLPAWLDHRAERLAAAEQLAARDDFRRRLGDQGAASRRLPRPGGGGTQRTAGSPFAGAGAA